MQPDTDIRSGGADREPGSGLGIVLTVVLMVAYFGFIGLGAFAPQVLARPVVAGGTTTIAFAYGLFVIALGVVLTTIFVWVTNRRSA